MRYLCIIVIIWFFQEDLYAQETFHKIYNYESPYSFAHGIHVTDSCYYFGASEGEGNEVDLVFGKMNLSGDIEYTSKVITPGEFDGAFNSLSRLQDNFRGNFMFGYVNRLYTLGYAYPKIVEISPSGIVVNEFSMEYLYNDSLTFIDNGKILAHNEDSSYYGAFTYVDFTTDSDPVVGFDGEQGTMLFKLNYLGDTLWTKKFYNPSLAFGRPYYASFGMNYLSNGHILLAINEAKIYGGVQEDLSWSKIHFLEVDLDGNLLNEWEFQNTQHCWAGASVLPLSDGSFIHSYLESELTGTPPNADYFWHRPILSKLDANFQQIWKNNLVPTFANISESATPINLVSVNDSVFAGAYTWYDINWSTYKHDISTRIFNRHVDGNEIWHRDYHFFPLTDSLNEADYRLKDFQLTPDGGYIMCGSVNNFDTISAGNGGQYAYFLKTNCLGFLGEPEASAEYVVQDGFNVEFHNTSMQAGSYTWYFGDGDSLRTEEYADTISHVYSGFATSTPSTGSGINSFEVMLVAYGCNGKTDTITFEVIPTLHADPTVVTNGNGFFSIFPNPILSGTELYVYLNGLDPSDGDVRIDVYTSTGRLVQEIPITAMEGTYIIKSSLASGVYILALFQGDTFLEMEKLMVK